MRFLPKRHFRWREPKTFLQLSDAFEKAQRRWCTRPLWVLAGAAALMTHWFVSTLDPNKHPPPISLAIPLALGAGVFLAYLMPWVISFCPSEVHLYEKHLYRVRGDTHRSLKYSEVAAFSWRVRDDFATLVLRLRTHKPDLLLGVPPDVSREAVSQFLLARQIPCGEAAGDAAADPGVGAPSPRGFHPVET